jgi:hypothetical protein
MRFAPSERLSRRFGSRGYTHGIQRYHDTSKPVPDHEQLSLRRPGFPRNLRPEHSHMDFLWLWDERRDSRIGLLPKTPCATGKSAEPTSTGSSSWPPSPRPLFRWSPQTSSTCPRTTDELMLPSCRRASVDLDVPVEQTTLIYKEAPEFLRRLWRQQPADSPELFRCAPGAAARNPATGVCGVSW